MSADNWTECPKCKAAAEAEQAKAADRAGRAYGKVTPEEYMRLVQVAASPPKLGDTLREDYGIGIDEGVFCVSYSARCDRCGFKFGFKHEEKVT